MLINERDYSSFKNDTIDDQAPLTERGLLKPVIKVQQMSVEGGPHSRRVSQGEITEEP